MATKLNLLQAFASGNAAGSLAAYFNYAPDHDSNYSQIQTSFNALVDEVSAAQMFDAQIQLDILLPLEDAANPRFTKGRFSTASARVRVPTSTTVEVRDGLIYLGGRISVIGATIDYTGLPNGTYVISVDPTSGNLTNTLSGAVPVGNLTIVTVTWDGSLDATTDIVDNLYNGGRSLVTGESVHIFQPVFNPADPGASIFSTAHPARTNPTVRAADIDGAPYFSGFYSTGGGGFVWQSTEGIAGAFGVIGGFLNPIGQVLLFEQGRFQIERRTTQSIANTGNVAISWTTPVANSPGQRTDRREPENYFADPYSSGGVTVTVPNDAGLNGTHRFTANLVIDSQDATFFDVRIRATNGTPANISRVRVPAAPTETAISLAGEMDLVANDTIQVQITHDATVSCNLTFARFTGMLMGAGA